MNIDMHFTATYTIARLAGFNKEQANIIAYSSQYVDEAIHGGHFHFSNHACLELTPAAHRMLDYRNFKELANHHVWIPFHFLPGNHYDKNLESIPEMVQRLVCKPNSQPAQDLLDVALKNREAPYALHLLGTISHTYMDTWAHQDFVGINHELNEVEEILHFDESKDHHRTKHITSYYQVSFLQKIIMKLIPSLLNNIAPLGHGPALSYPDHPFLKWKYKNWNGEIITRDNSSIYLDALEHLYAFFCKFTHNSTPLKNSDRELIIHIINEATAHDGEDRMLRWMDYIASGGFSFGQEQCHFKLNGADSWIYEAFQVQDHDNLKELIESLKTYPQEFYQSNWFQLQVALAIHRNSVLYAILPKYNIISA